HAAGARSVRRPHRTSIGPPLHDGAARRPPRAPAPRPPCPLAHAAGPGGVRPAPLSDRCRAVPTGYRGGSAPHLAPAADTRKKEEPGQWPSSSVERSPPVSGEGLAGASRPDHDHLGIAATHRSYPLRHAAGWAASPPLSRVVAVCVPAR